MGKALIITTGGGTDTSDGNPNPDTRYILSGYTVYDQEGELQTGALEQKELVKTLNPGGSVTIPAGYYPGDETGTVSAVALADKTAATAVKGNVLDGKTGWNKGSKITGTMANKGAVTGTLDANGTYTVAAGWHDGKGAISQSLSAKAAANVTPGTAKKTVIAANKWASGKQTVLGNANLKAENIKKNVTIFGVKGTFYIDATDTVNGVYLVKDGCPQLGYTFKFFNHAGVYVKTNSHVVKWTDDVKNNPPTTVNGSLRFRCMWYQDNNIKDTTFEPWFAKARWEMEYDNTIPLKLDTGYHQIYLTVNDIKCWQHKDAINFVGWWYVGYWIYTHQYGYDPDGNMVTYNTGSRTSGWYHIDAQYVSSDIYAGSISSYPVSRPGGWLNSQMTSTYKNKVTNGKIPKYTNFTEKISLHVDGPITWRWNPTATTDRQLLACATIDLFIKDIYIKSHASTLQCD